MGLTTVSIRKITYFIHFAFLAITQSLTLAGLLQWGVRQRKYTCVYINRDLQTISYRRIYHTCFIYVGAEVTNHLTSVERILEYSQLEPEKQPAIPQNVSDEWPKHGKIEFRNVFYRYSIDSDAVLRGLSFLIKPKEKISVVGRTGAGKSSLINAIFRLAEVDGDILIDDVNTASIDLNMLRSRISIIPQEPTLFSGTLRRYISKLEHLYAVNIFMSF